MRRATTCACARFWSASTNFYPRSPCGERRAARLWCRSQWQISIHALLAESDGRTPKATRPKSPFLSTLSLRRATRLPLWPGRQRCHFYPRSPCGERRASRRPPTNRKVISIHALLAESDVNEIPYQREIDQFLSTLSLRRATQRHSPDKTHQRISIHALLAESDRVSETLVPRQYHFYPRSPCGERLMRYRINAR